MRILLVDDDEQLMEVLADSLVRQHYAVDIADTGEMGWEFILLFNYDLVVLDWMLPDVDGVNLCRQIRSKGYTMPIMLLTARDRNTDKVMGLDAGADDYLAKPFEMAELDARVRAVLRRRPTHQPEQLVIGPLTVDQKHRQVIHEGETIGLAKKEFAAFEFLAESSGRTVSKSSLMNYVYGVGEDVSETTLEVLVSRLRKKISNYGVRINMIRGLGYFLKADR